MMKKITRMLFFSTAAIYLTSLWNKGFQVDFNPEIFVKTIFLIALFYYLVIHVSKIILLPINLLTLGLLSSLLYFLLFYLFITHFSLLQIKPWEFSGVNFYGIMIKPFQI